MPFKDEKKKRAYLDKVEKRKIDQNKVRVDRQTYIAKLKESVDRSRSMRGINIKKGKWQKGDEEIEGEYYCSLVDGHYHIKLAHHSAFIRSADGKNLRGWNFIGDIEDAAT